MTGKVGSLWCGLRLPDTQLHITPECMSKSLLIVSLSTRDNKWVLQLPCRQSVVRGVFEEGSLTLKCWLDLINSEVRAQWIGGRSRSLDGTSSALTAPAVSLACLTSPSCFCTIWCCHSLKGKVEYSWTEGSCRVDPLSKTWAPATLLNPSIPFTSFLEPGGLGLRWWGKEGQMHVLP